jgi:hypothetical protein
MEAASDRRVHAANTYNMVRIIKVVFTRYSKLTVAQLMMNISEKRGEATK